MNKAITSILLTIIMAITMPITAHVTEIISSNQFETLLRERKGLLVVVYFYSEECGPCKRYAPKFKALSDVHPAAAFVKIKTTSNALTKLCIKYKIRCLPTTLFFKNESEIGRVEGTREKEIEEAIQKYQ